MLTTPLPDITVRRCHFCLYLKSQVFSNYVRNYSVSMGIRWKLIFFKERKKKMNAE